MSVGIAALYDAQGVVSGFLTILDDVTERNLMEEALREREILRVELEKERELNELKTRFVSMVSHEYRNPLATILITSNALRDYIDRMNPPQVLERLDRIRDQVAHMTRLMEEVLDIAKLEAGAVQFAPAPLDLDVLCREVVDEFRSVASAASRLEYTRTGAFTAANVDAHLMRQVLTNLLSNALKYSPPESQVQVHLARNGHTAVLRVTDRGIGIPEADQPRLFAPFHRARNVGEISGTGLGLAIVKRAVELHGGAITCESGVDAGTTFTVTLPFVLEASTGADQLP
ncbi:MAG: HAMP domain-containing histidine kinase [Anaerolineae bacterium]|nr:HAMP domain-containing histidine kinase [Anaerolineae bacterium]